jgi:hypothetical protein
LPKGHGLVASIAPILNSGCHASKARRSYRKKEIKGAKKGTQKFQTNKVFTIVIVYKKIFYGIGPIIIRHPILEYILFKMTRENLNIKRNLF